MQHLKITRIEILRTLSAGLAERAGTYRGRILTVSMLAYLSSAIIWFGSACAADITPGVGTASVLKALLALTLVLVAVFGLAWIARRFSPAPRGGSWLQLRGALAIGTRERVVIIEVQDIWLVVGVAPGQVNVLHTLPKPEEAIAEIGNTNDSGTFSTWLAKAVKRQTHA